MYSRSYGIASVALLLAVTLPGSVRAQAQHQQHHPDGPQAVEAPPSAPGMGAPGQAPAGAHMQGMMQGMQGMMDHMQDMMQGMQGMMGRRGMMERRGMMADDVEDDDDAEASMPQRDMMERRGVMERRGMMGHRGMMGRHLERFIRQLELTEEQQPKVQALVRAHRKDAIRIQAEIAIKKLDVRALVEAKPVEIPKVKDLLQAIAAQHIDLYIAHLALMQDIHKLLTPEQQQKFRTMRQQMMHGHGGMMGQE